MKRRSNLHNHGISFVAAAPVLQSQGSLDRAGRGVPIYHDLAHLLDIAREAGVAVPPELVDVDLLTDYTTLARYPGFAEIGGHDRDAAVAIARAVVGWAESELASE